MCEQQASFNAASVAHEAIGSVDAYIQRRGVDPSLIVVGVRSGIDQNVASRFW
jgi:hypothetical protein